MTSNLKKWSRSIPLALCLTGALSVNTSTAGSITTPEILASSLCLDCIDYQVIGMCLWMTCTPLGCDTDTSIKVKHRLPDMVAMSYLNTGEAPWQATQWMSPTTPGAKGGGSSHKRSPTLLDNATVTFQNTDIIGHPAEGTFFEMLSSFGYTLEGPSTPFMPYYLSSLDTLGWRFNIPDVFNVSSWNPLTNRLGNWGSVYPRGGFSIQKQPYKSAAMAAYKASHVVTRPMQSRVYQSLIADKKQGYWPPEAIGEKDDETFWQPLYPKQEMKAVAWPDIDDSTTTGDPYAERISETGEYVWGVWRTYRGCEQKGAMLVAHFGN
ncbi:TIGR03756 family integrating conjugative element protein [Shewanella sairae]|nr:TIGR03756 family integrating conjugative element protein [Shewanella sairae]MCL1130465.1 TIGR03756 family integrating conjugative element protein [Shewanella sairae]